MLTQADHPMHAQVCGLVFGVLLGVGPVVLVGAYHLSYPRSERRRHWSRIADWLYEVRK